MEKQIKRLKWLFIILGTQRFKVGQWEAFKNAKGGLFVNFGGHFKVTVFWFINLLYVIKGATFQIKKVIVVYHQRVVNDWPIENYKL